MKGGSPSVGVCGVLSFVTILLTSTMGYFLPRTVTLHEERDAEGWWKE